MLRGKELWKLNSPARRPRIVLVLEHIIAVVGNARWVSGAGRGDIDGAVIAAVVFAKGKRLICGEHSTAEKSREGGECKYLHGLEVTVKLSEVLPLLAAR